MPKIIAFTIMLILLNVATDKTGVLTAESAAAQNKGTITGEVFVRESDDGKKSLLVAIGNKCKDNKDPCEPQPIDKVKITFEDLKPAGAFEMPKFSTFEETQEYKDFLKAVAGVQQKDSQKIPPKEALTPDISESDDFKAFFQWVEWRNYPEVLPDPAPMREPDIGEPELEDPTSQNYRIDEQMWKSLFFDNSWNAEAEQDGDKLILKLGYRHDPKSFKPTYGIKARFNIDDRDSRNYAKNRLRIEAENEGKTVFSKKVKAQKLPRIDVQNRSDERINMPNTLHPGENALISLTDFEDAIKDVAVERIKTIKQTAKYLVFWIDAVDNLAEDAYQSADRLPGVRTIKQNNPFSKTIIGVKRGPVVIPESKRNKQNQVDCEKNEPPKPICDEIPRPIEDDTIEKITETVRLVSKFYEKLDALTGDKKAGATLYNEFGEILEDFEFPDVEIVEPSEVKPANKDLEGVDSEGPKDGSNACLFGNPAASTYVLEGRKLCVCGCFFNNNQDWDSIFTTFTLDGKPIVPKAASPSTVSFEIQEGLSPGLHRIAYKTPGGTTKTVEFRVLAVQGNIDQNRLWTGQGTTMTLRILGSADPLPLLIENKTPSIITITGGSRQIVNTSGGANNEIQRQVLGISRGKFSIDYSLDQPICPCLAGNK